MTATEDYTNAFRASTSFKRFEDQKSGQHWDSAVVYLRSLHKYHNQKKKRLHLKPSIDATFLRVMEAKVACLSKGSSTWFYCVQILFLRESVVSHM